MFEDIHFTHADTTTPIVSAFVDKEKAGKNEKIDKGSINDAEFYIAGGVDAFLRPPVTEYARENLYYMQAFNIFYYKKGSYTRRKNYNSFLILYTYKGIGLLEYEGKKYELTPEKGAFIDCRKPHYYKAIEDWEVGVFHFWGAQSEHMYEEFSSLGNVDFQDPVTGRFHLKLEELISIYDSPSLQRDLRASHCIDGILLNLILKNSNLSLSNNNIPRSIQKAMKYMEENYSEQISLDDLAKLTNTNKFHLAKEFKRYTSFSPHDYLIQLRINQARLLLRNTTLPAVKIAYEVGIYDINNFNYLFKKRIGKTPIQYRNSPNFLV